MKPFPTDPGPEGKLQVTDQRTRSWPHTWVSEYNDEEVGVSSKKEEIKLLDVLSNRCHFSASICKHRGFFCHLLVNTFFFKVEFKGGTKKEF